MHAQRIGLLIGLLALAGSLSAEEKITLRLSLVPPRSATGIASVAELAVIDAFFKRHPQYRYESVTGLWLPEGLSEAQQMMAFAGDQGPDVFNISIRQVQNYIRQGLILPLDDLIEETRGHRDAGTRNSYSPPLSHSPTPPLPHSRTPPWV